MPKVIQLEKVRKKITKDKYWTAYLFFMLTVILVSIFYTLRHIVYLTR